MRYPSKIELIINSDSTTPSRINRPYLDITYVDKNVRDLDVNPNVGAEFKVSRMN